MGVPYNKPHLTYEQQVSRLQDRGLVVSDKNATIDALRTIGYYRLGAYLHTFRQASTSGEEGHDARLSTYQPGSRVEDVLALWAFDRELRLVLLDGLETFEIAFRSSVAYWAGAEDPFIHLRTELLGETFTSRSGDEEATTAKSGYEEWIEKYEERLDGAKNEMFIKWFFHKYDGRLPIWTAVEIFELGQLSRLYRALPLGVRRSVANDFQVDLPKAFASWAAAFNGLRNLSAHHSRLWNRTLVTTAARPKLGEIAALDHLQSLDEHASKKVYASLALLTWVLGQRSLAAPFKKKLLTVLNTFPNTDHASLRSAGFPAGWKDLSLWRA